MEKQSRIRPPHTSHVQHWCRSSAPHAGTNTFNMEDGERSSGRRRRRDGSPDLLLLPWRCLHRRRSFPPSVHAKKAPFVGFRYACQQSALMCSNFDLRSLILQASSGNGAKKPFGFSERLKNKQKLGSENMVCASNILQSLSTSVQMCLDLLDGPACSV